MPLLFPDICRVVGHLAILIVSSSLSAQETSLGKALVITPSSAEFTYPVGSRDAAFTITFTNVSSEPVRIEAVHLGCSCAKSTGWSASLLGGAQARFDVPPIRLDEVTNNGLEERLIPVAVRYTSEGRTYNQLFEIRLRPDVVVKMTPGVALWFKSDPIKPKAISVVADGKIASAAIDNERSPFSFLIREKTDNRLEIEVSPAQSDFRGYASKKICIDLEDQRQIKLALQAAMLD